MKLGRFSTGSEQTPRVGIFNEEEQTARDITTEVDSFIEVLKTITNDGALPETGETFQFDSIQYLPPTTLKNTTFAVALNYREHADEASMAIPDRPLVFLKLYQTLIGHNEPIANYTDVTQRLDYEAELAVVIGRETRNISPDEALENVAGYTILNDTTARDVQRVMVGNTERMDWFSGKAMESTTPIGPYLVTTEEIDDPMKLQITSRVNDELMQEESTEMMIRDVAELISFISTRAHLGARQQVHPDHLRLRRPAQH